MKPVLPLRPWVIAALWCCWLAAGCGAPDPQVRPAEAAPAASARPAAPAAASLGACGTPAPQPAQPGCATVAAEPAPSEAAPAWAGPEDLGRSAAGNALPRLPRLYTALRQLELGARADHVRIAWLGDSHTQIDIWTDTVRRQLQERFGNGGPGFVHVGWKKGYRHAGIELKVKGWFALQPKQLVTFKQYQDGVLGLGGVRLIPGSPESRAWVKAQPAALSGPGRWDLGVRLLRESAWVEITPAGGATERLTGSAPASEAIRHVEVQTPGPGGEIEVRASADQVQLLGVVIERRGEPGVVLDTLGLASARIRTALSWDEATWVAELGRRRPELAVLAFGTNEAGHPKIRSERHQEHLKALVQRIRRAAPAADCLVIGPIDRGSGGKMGDTIRYLNQQQQLAAEALGCAFWSGQTAMGGKGSIRRWSEEVPPAAEEPRVHLTARGYRRLGQLLLQDLLAAYDAGTHPPPVR